MLTRHNIVVNIYGAQGSNPASILGYNTTCLEVQVPGSPLIILDMGSGAQVLGGHIEDRIAEEMSLNPLASGSEFSHRRELHILSSHFHWDHIQGFPFFGPLFQNDPKFNLHFYGPARTENALERRVTRMMQRGKHFPASFADTPAQEYCTPLNLRGQGFRIGSTRVESIGIPHTTKTLGYSISHGLEKFVFLTDIELTDSPPQRVVDFCSGGTLLYIDAQYAPEELLGAKQKEWQMRKQFPRIGWGHSTYAQAVDLAQRTGIPKVILGHHEPSRTRNQLDCLFLEAQDYARRSDVTVMLARDGDTYRL